MTLPTHAIIDGAIHKIDEIEEVGDSAHTHVVTFDCCNLTFHVRGEHQFETHAAISEDLYNPANDVGALKMRADEAGLQMVKVEEGIAVAQNKLQDLIVKTQSDLAEIGLIVDKDTAMINLKISKHPEFLSLLRDVEGAMKIHEDAKVVHAEACAAFHASRDPDRRWITSDEDVTTCGGES